MTIKISRFLFVFILLTAVVPAGQALNGGDVDLKNYRWMHGAKSCEHDQNPLIEVVHAADSSYVLRQNKCVTFEAPFIYVLFGKTTALVVDTGANELASESPIFATVKSLYDKEKANGSPDLEKILVVHSHSHNDHKKGDPQFSKQDYIEVVDTSNSALAKQLGLTDWPNLNNTINLGERELVIIPTPGHQEQSISIYDRRTRWLLTGDSLYPGSIRVKSWVDYKNSIDRLFEFSRLNPVSHILGAHIEMNRKTNKLYKIGTIYQPNETPLALDASHLEALNTKLKTVKKPKKIVFDSFVIAPLSRFEKLIIKAATIGK